jgi:hypothetical protein
MEKGPVEGKVPNVNWRGQASSITLSGVTNAKHAGNHQTLPRWLQILCLISRREGGDEGMVVSWE